MFILKQSGKRSNSPSNKVAYFDSINGMSVWHAAKYSLKGWKVSYFRRSPVGSLIEKGLETVSNGRVQFSAVDVRIGDFKRLFYKATRISVAFTEAWFGDSSDHIARDAIDSLGQSKRAAAFVKKAMSLRTHTWATELGVYEGLTVDSPDETRLFVQANSKTLYFCDVYKSLSNDNTDIQTYPSPFEKAELLSRLARYYLYILRQIANRGVVIENQRQRYLLAKSAMWPIGSRPSDDFLVDGEDILPDDLLLYYGSLSLKSRVKSAVTAANEAGYATVAWDHVAVALNWILRPRTVNSYLVQPLWQTARALLFGRAGYSCDIVSLMLDLRRAKFGWDVFFEKYSIGAVFDPGVMEEQVAVTMSADNYGASSIKVQLSEILDEFNPNQQYLTHHYHFIWGQGVADMWRNSWCTDHVIPVGYTWGNIHQTGMLKKQITRDRYGVTGETKLVIVFDTSADKGNFVSSDALSRFYDAIKNLADTLDNAFVVLKPKNAVSPPESGSCDKVIWEDFLHANTNDLIAAADLVISMAHSSTFNEALICGVPAITYDETCRSWTNVLPHHERFVFTNSFDLCEAAKNILDHGIEPEVWRDVQEKIKWNYGEADGMAIDRIRQHILEACDVKRPVEATQELAVSKTGV